MEQFTRHLNLNFGQSENSISKLYPGNPILLISELHHDPEADHTFNNWVDKCEDVFRKGLAEILEEKKVKLFLRRLETVEHKKPKITFV